MESFRLEKPPTLQEVNRLKSILKKGLSMKIPTYDILRKHEHLYDQISPYITSYEERFNIEREFGNHEQVLSETSGLTARPSPKSIKRQREQAVSRSQSLPDFAQPGNPPSAAGKRQRIRSASEEALVANEVINWDDIN